VPDFEIELGTRHDFPALDAILAESVSSRAR